MEARRQNSRLLQHHRNDQRPSDDLDVTSGRVHVAGMYEEGTEGDGVTDLVVSEDEGLDLGDDDLDSLENDMSRSVSRAMSRSRSGVRRPQSGFSSDAEPMTFNVDIAQRNARAMREGSVELAVSMSDIANIQRGRANTPATVLAEFWDDTYNDAGLHRHDGFAAQRRPPNPSTPGAESRNAAYHHAPTLLHQRCPSSSRHRLAAMSATQRPLAASASSGSQNLRGAYAPKSFLIYQRRPTANMAPLQAWRGYHGNVYFEPIKVLPGPYSAPPDHPLSPDTLHHDSPASPTGDQVAPPTGHQVAPPAGTAPHRNGGLSSAKSLRSSTRSSTRSPTRLPQHRQMSLLDKKAVLHRQDDNIHEDIMWIVGQDSTGSLGLQPDQEERFCRKKDQKLEVCTDRWSAQKSQNAKSPSRAWNQRDQMNQGSQSRPGSRPATGASTASGRAERNRICRGSTAHGRSDNKRKTRGSPALLVTGDKCAQLTQPQILSPLLRTQTQYSESSQRVTTNSPDQYHDKLPPLEQLRASLRHMDSAANQGALPAHVIAPLERMKFEETDPTKSKPFVKYNAEVRNSANVRLRVQTAQ